jgi:hypothetical protein
MVKRLILAGIFLFPFLFLMSQPAFYSQRNTTSVLQNPAFTGLGHGKWRISGIYQSADNAEAYNHNTYAGSFDYRIDPQWRHSDYGQIIERAERFSFGLGLTAEVRKGTPEHHPYEGWYVSAAFHYKPNKDFLLSVGAQPGFFTPSNWFPYPSYTLQYPADSVVLPGRAAIRRFDYNAGILIGLGNIDCWLEDLPKRFVAGIALRHAKRDQRTEVIPGREIYIHSAMLLEASRRWGLVPQASLFLEGSNHFSTGIQFLYRRHFGYADRFRFAMHYKSTGYAIAEAGFRIYGGANQTLGFDFTVSYDYALKTKSINQPWPTSVLEIGIVISPLKKCWGNSQCTNDYQLERL